MKLTKCSNNHFYDADKYSECPHCNPAAAAVKPHSENGVKNILDRIRTGAGISVKETPAQPSQFQSEPTSSLWHPQNDSADKTAALTGGTDFSSRMGHSTQPEQPPEASRAVPEASPALQEQIPAEQQSAPVSQAAAQPAAADDAAPSAPGYPDPMERSRSGSGAASQQGQSLQDAVNEVKAPDSTEDVKTMAFYEFDSEEPVVGWLVCVKGMYMGESFNLITGRNNIGRSLKMDVPLAKETSVSRDRHAVITYEPMHRKFYIQPGEGHSLSYVNEELLLMPRELKEYDHIQLGSCELIFVPFCGSSFTWDTYI